MSDTPEALRAAMSAVVELREELLAIENWLVETHPHEMERVGQLRKEIPAAIEKAKDVLRAHGTSVQYLGYDFQVSRKSKTVADTESIVARARERGDLLALLECGFLEYSVAPNLLDRIPEKMRPIYATYVEKKAMTPAVTMPKGFGE